MENNNEQVLNENKKSSKKKRNIIIGIIVIVIIAIIIGGYLVLFKSKDKKQEKEKPIEKVEKKPIPKSAYYIYGNELESFDLAFLQLNNNKKNKVYSPLSIKYALEMLEDGSNGETKEQIASVIGKYSAKKYTNNKHMSIANALFIKDSYKSSIKDSYIKTLKSKYNADVVYDSFKTPKVLNSWVSKKTYKLINNLSNDISALDYILVNTLAINMEWVKQIQSRKDFYSVSYDHIDYSKAIGSLDISGYTGIKFKDLSYKAKAVEIGAVINKYDIVNEVGEDKIRKTVSKEYKKWLDEGAPTSCDGIETEPDVETYVNQYIKDIKKGYKDISSSTDLSFYVDDNVKVFAKDLKKYNGTTLQYIGIMPTKDNLDNYLKNVKVTDINTLINSLKPIELDSFKDGVITEIYGYIPMFKFDYNLDLINNLKKLGITNVFDSNKADLSNLSTDKAFISQVSHKTKIEFSNEGIKAAAVTSPGGAGAAECGFDYLYKPPVEKIDLTFNKPFLFIIRDKDTKEVWFTGTVYKPLKNKNNLY